MKAAEKKNEYARPLRVILAVFAVGFLVVACGGIVAKIARAQAAGDVQGAQFQIATDSVAGVFLLVFIAALCVRYIPGHIRARALRAQFSGAVVITGRMNSDVRVGVPYLAWLAGNTIPIPLPVMTFGVTADAAGLSFRGGASVPQQLPSVAWSQIQSIRVVPRLVQTSPYPALQTVIVDSDATMSFRVAPGRALGLSLAKPRDVEALAQRLNELRVAAVGAA